MKITIIQFSPSGSTRKVTSMLESELKGRGQQVQVLDITGDEDFFVRRDIPAFLNKHVEPHDLLLIGSPVYAHHLQYHVQDLIAALPKPDRIWGSCAIPYVCYGGISSGIALKEAAALLKKSGRIVPAGMKISAPHSMTRAFMEREFNADKLQSGTLPEVAELADRIMELDGNPLVQCNARSMNYNCLAITLKANLIFKEKLWHEKRYPQISIDGRLCSNCGKCVKVCPVRHLSKGESQAVENALSPCIHCLNCVTSCPAKAIKLTGDLEKGRAFMTKMIAKNGNKEVPENAVYPIPGFSLKDTFADMH